tara:strand:+ start:240 stop:779 length:540 start_codon:yes stop_codon:yes gene_type:complete
MAKSPEHYVDNPKFLKALTQYRAQYQKAKKSEKENPQIPDYIGECFLKIATNLARRPNFMNYTFREDMVSDGVENCLIYAHNFDPAKTSNPFGYFTFVIHNAFVRRIQRERKHTYLRYKLIEQAVIEGDTQTTTYGGGQYHVDSAMLSFDNVQEFIRKYDDYTDKRRERRRVSRDEAVL